MPLIVGCVRRGLLFVIEICHQGGEVRRVGRSNSVFLKVTMIDLKSNLKKSLLAHKFDGNLYSLCDYDGKGLLVDILTTQNEKCLNRELKLLVPFMYCSGQGVAIKETLLTNKAEKPKKTLFANFLVSNDHSRYS